MVRKKEINGVVLKSSDIAFIADKDDLVRVVALEKKFNGVEIVLLRAGKPEAQ
jgi:malate/lactate dehydrogenase